jgi:PAS domain S-box-containing protein
MTSEPSGELGIGEDRYRMLVDAITDYAIYILDPTGIVTSWNPGAQRFKGYAPDEILGRHFSCFYTEEDRLADLPGRALRTARSEGRFEMEGWRVRKDGAQFWASVVIDPIRTPSGDLVGFAKVTRDLTERKISEESLRQSEQQFKLLVQGVTDYAIYMLDPQGQVTNWNAGAERIKGYRPEDIVGEHFSRFYTEEDQERGEPRRALGIAAREGRYEREGWRVRKDGTRFWAHVVIDAIRDEAGELTGFAKVTRDVTERREAQRALDQAREALFQSQKLEAIGQLTGGVAHDFNNLLMAVLGSLELAQKRLPDDPKLARLIENAVLGAKRGASLTQRMLSFARRQELKRQAMAALVRGMEGLLDRSLGPTVTVRVDIPDDLPAAETDANQLESALLNLAVNARDAMPDGGEITISATVETTPRANDEDAAGLKVGRYVRLAVSDTGAGMDEATLLRAVEPFFTTKGVGKGTGLGVPMVQGLAVQSGGKFELASQVGVGTTATLWLPAVDQIAPSAAPVADQSESVDDERLRILAVDDDELVLMNTAALLEDLGHTVLVAGSGAEALEIVDRETRLDLVMSDQLMPGMTGVQLADALGIRRPDLPLVLTTGYAELPSDVGGRLPRLSKPFTQADLVRMIQQVRRDQERALAETNGRGGLSSQD